MARFCAAIVLTLAVAACATIPNALQPDEARTFKLTGVTVGYVPDAVIVWDDAYRAYAASKGIPDHELAQATNSPEAKIFVQNFLAPRVKTAMEQNVSPLLAGTRPVRIQVTVKNFQIASAVQRIVIGGGFSMIAEAAVIDARTGATIVSHPSLVGAAAAGQGILGTAVQAALDAGQGLQPADRVVNSYAVAFGNWLLKK